MGTVYLQNRDASDWIRHRNSKWIPYRKRVYLYWFKYLIEAERDTKLKVDWTKYKGWGGSNVILGSKFDEWWEDRWEDLFGLEKRTSKQKFPLSRKPKTEYIRLCYLCYIKRDVKAETRTSTYRGVTKTYTLGKNINIARAVYEYEMGISGEKKMRNSEDDMNAYQLNPDLYQKEERYVDATGKEIVDTFDESSGEYSRRSYLQTVVGRYLRGAKKTLNNVCKGQFP